MNGNYFHESEFACHDGTPYPSEWLENRLAALISQLDAIRIAWKGPLRVVSGYRTPAHNAAIGGAGASQHMEGRAADIAPHAVAGVMEAQCRELHALILRMMAQSSLPLIGGLGVYPGWVHVDVRPKPTGGHVAQWHGQGIGSEA